MLADLGRGLQRPARSRTRHARKRQWLTAGLRQRIQQADMCGLRVCGQTAVVPDPRMQYVFTRKALDPVRGRLRRQLSGQFAMQALALRHAPLVAG
ncbi:hypothetical protein D3C87_1625540 [compost metagenome]